jgi:hypothetical protein
MLRKILTFRKKGNLGPEAIVFGLNCTIMVLFGLYCTKMATFGVNCVRFRMSIFRSYMIEDACFGICSTITRAYPCMYYCHPTWLLGMCYSQWNNVLYRLLLATIHEV